jgi:hypothetical protein
MQVILLFWNADYPGLGKLSSMKHAGAYGCHWCEGYFYPHSPGHNVCIHNRRNLRGEHPFRTNPQWEVRDDRTPNPLRTTEEVETKARELSDMVAGPEKDRAQTASGIDGFCVLLLLHMFDIVWDMLPDMMHIVKGTDNAYMLHVMYKHASIMHYCTYICIFGALMA